MPILESKLSPRAADFLANTDRMQMLVADLRDRVATAALGGGDAARNKHIARGKLLPRERIDLLIDPVNALLDEPAEQSLPEWSDNALINDPGDPPAPQVGADQHQPQPQAAQL